MTRNRKVSFLLLGAIALLVSGTTSAQTRQFPGRAQLHERATAKQTVHFRIFLPPQHQDQLEKLVQAQADTKSGHYHKWLKPEEFHKQYDLDDASVEELRSQLASQGLASVREGQHELKVTAPAADIERTFNTKLRNGTMNDGSSVVAATEGLTVPEFLHRVHGTVLGLSGVVHHRVHASLTAKPDSILSTVGPYTFYDLKQAYHFPSYQTLTGRGATIAILMAGGYLPSDMEIYFNKRGLPTPRISEVTVNGGAPFDPNSGGTFEATLDIQQSAGMAPNANIVLYSVPSLHDSDLLEGLEAILQQNIADVVNMSFSSPEISYLPDYNGGVDQSYVIAAYHSLFLQGSVQGITFVTGSGDYGALPIPALDCFDPEATSCSGFLPSVEYPAGDPLVTSVGGTNLVTNHTPGSFDSTYVRESAFADPLTQDIEFGTVAQGGSWGSGGGSSIFFSKPSYQNLVDTGDSQARTVPDVALQMGGCPAHAICGQDDSGDLEILNGLSYDAIGTSASSPDFAGLVALQVEQAQGRHGLANPYIYSLAGLQDKAVYNSYPVFRTGIPGFNGLYSTTPTGYNRVLGNGTVDGINYLLNPLLPAAGVGGTPTNP